MIFKIPDIFEMPGIFFIEILYTKCCIDFENRILYNSNKLCPLIKKHIEKGKGGE